MELASIPIIVVICYLIGEIYKVIFRNKTEIYKYIPLLLGILGGIIGVLMYMFSKNTLLGVNSIFDSFILGVISGFTSTGTNQVIKQLISNEGK